MTPTSPRVFISYSHDSEEHKERVLALVEKLRGESVDCEVDRFESSPPEGWPTWMDTQLRNAKFVLIVCTETYRRRFEDEEIRGKGKGARWEGFIVKQAIYESDSRNERFIPILFEESDRTNVPGVLKGATNYLVDSEKGYDELYARLTNQPAVQRSKLGKLRILRGRAEHKNDSKNKAFHREAPEHEDTLAKSESSEKSKPLIRPAKGDFVLLRAGEVVLLAQADKIERANDLVRVHIEPEEPKVSSFFLSLRDRGQGRVIELVDGLHAIKGNVKSVTSTRERGREVWVIELNESSWPHNSFSEFSYNGISADEIAEIRARNFLLNEKSAVLRDALGIILHRPLASESVNASWQKLRNEYVDNRRLLLVILRSMFVLELIESGVVAHVHRLELGIRENQVEIDFEGQRPNKLSNVAPPVISFKGSRPL